MLSIVGLGRWQKLDPTFVADGRYPLEVRRLAGCRRIARIVDGILTELAERSHTTKQAIRYTINQLEAAGYVERVPDPTDGRAKIIRFTDRGWQGRRVADEIIASIEQEYVQKLGEERRRQFEALMKEVSSVLEENGAQA